MNLFDDIKEKKIKIGVKENYWAKVFKGAEFGMRQGRGFRGRRSYFVGFGKCGKWEPIIIRDLPNGDNNQIKLSTVGKLTIIKNGKERSQT